MWLIMAAACHQHRRFHLEHFTPSVHGAVLTADSEGGIEDVADQWTLVRIVRTHSDFVGYPIISRHESEELGSTEDGKLKKDAKPTFVIEDKTLNSMTPIWSRPQSEITESEYGEFYRHIARDWTEPFEVIALKAEGSNRVPGAPVHTIEGASRPFLSRRRERAPPLCQENHDRRAL
jgi:HSP90 family molecular chaperone